jgi:hypothetical protein
MIVACIALAVALGGTSYAALKLPRNSVGVNQLRANAVTSGKVRNGALTAKDFKRSTLLRGPRGAQGPKGDSAPGAIPRAAFASRDPATTSGSAITLGPTAADLVGLDVAVGTGGYAASSGKITASGPSRLIASGQAVILNAAPATGNVNCRLALVTTDVKPLGSYVNANVPGAGGYLPVGVSSGADVEAGTYDVRLQCFSSEPAMQFHRGNLTVAVAPR